MALVYVGGTINQTVGSTTSDFVVSLTGLTGGVAAAPSTGDIVIAVVATGSDADRSIGVVTADYNEIAELYSDDTNDTNFSISWKIMGGSPDTTITFTRSGATTDAIAGGVHVWRNVDQVTPLDVTSTTNTGINTGIPTPPAITPSTSGAIIICAGAGAHTAGAADFTTSELSNFRTITGQDTFYVSLGFGSFAWTSGTFTPVAFGGGSSSTNNSWCAATIALRPAATSNIKTYNTNTRANIKTINTNLIANVKTLNTNSNT